MILDAGFLISVDRGEIGAAKTIATFDRAGTSLATTEAVVAQVWRHGRTQASLARLLRATWIHPFADGRQLGELLGRSGTSDVVDAHLVLLATQLGEPILTGDPDDLQRLADSLGPARPVIHAWP